MAQPSRADVVIIGAGITGLSIGRELSRHKLRTVVVEKEADVAMGVSKTAGSLIYMGLFQAASLAIKDLSGRADLEAETESERMGLLWQGFQDFHVLAHELDIDHKHSGVLLFARDRKEEAQLDNLARLCGHLPGGTLVELDRKALFQAEPNLTPEARRGLLDTTGAMSVFGPEYVIAVYENGRANGLKVLLGAEFKGVEKIPGGLLVKTGRGDIKARFVLNCGGKYADRAADSAGPGRDWNLSFYRSQALVLDRNRAGTVRNIVGIPPAPGKIDWLYPLSEGNIHVYGAYYDHIEDRDFTATTRENFEDAINRMRALAPSLSARDVITSYVGVRIFHDKNPDDHLIESPPGNPNFLNVLVRMPGFTPAPALARKVVGLLEERGLDLVPKKRFISRRRAIPRFRFLEAEERARLIARDPAYGRVVCRCETVTEGEIVEAIRRGAVTIQGVQFRTRAGMGRCQRNFCGAKVADLLARELGRARSEITFKGPGYELQEAGGGR